MKIIGSIALGVLLTLSSIFLYSIYYNKYTRPQQLVNWYVSCLAKHQNLIYRNQWKTKQTPLEVCHLSDDQIKSIQEVN